MTEGLTVPAGAAEPSGGMGPITRRRQLGVRLLALRDTCGLSAEEAGERAGVSKATVSRYERAKGNVRWNQVDQLCRAYGASDKERHLLVELAKNSRDNEVWWIPFAGMLPDQMRMLLALENEAPWISHHTVGVVPGLLQTLGYAQEIRATPGNALPPQELQEFLRMRMLRQRILDRAAPPVYHVILDEAVVRRRVGSGQVMSAQLDHLLARGREPSISIQVLPFSAGAYSAALSTFIVFGGPDPSLDVVFLENQTGSLFLEEPPALKCYTEAMAFLRQEALDTTTSAELIAEASRTHLRNRK
ncbi:MULTISPECIES: helix-turn-helix transcriptional regulator [unclassified Streptomyces]|uniref:helix-turn-helix domain-containing protein n=1 Tax=unclassified Streptomyces TaxID=2593676 RepID=UPI002E2D2026|nr:helix-turn-helix transcriptional regulator [Streptomyces sp. NBC_00342]